MKSLHKAGWDDGIPRAETESVALFCLKIWKAQFMAIERAMIKLRIWGILNESILSRKSFTWNTDDTDGSFVAGGARCAKSV